MPPTLKPASFTLYSLWTGGLSLRNIKNAISAYRHIAVKNVALTLTLIVALVTAGAYATGYPVLLAALCTAGALIAADTLIRFPSAVATATVIALLTGFTAPLAVMYPVSIDASYSIMSLPDTVATYFATLALTGLLAHRTSRGRPWVTTFIAGLGIAFVGTGLAVLIPGVGFGWAWLVMALVLWYRANGKPWLARNLRPLWVPLWVKVRPNSAAKNPPVEPSRVRAERVAAALRKRQARKATTALLGDLPDGYTVYSDVALDRDNVTVQHVIIGPTGVWAVESEKVPGTIHSNPDTGLTHDTVPVALLLDNAAQRSQALTRHLRRMPFGRVDLHTLVVIHDAYLPMDVAGVMVGTHRHQRYVTINHPDALIATITAGKPTVRPKHLAHVNARLAPAASRVTTSDG